MKNMAKTAAIWVGFAAAGVTGCSHGRENKRVDARVVTETVDSPAKLDAQAKQLITHSPKITPVQRDKLMVLRQQTRTEMDRLGEESIKLRALLIEDIVSANYNEGDVRVIKKRIREVEGDRISTMFNAVERANTIMGREAAVNPKVMESFFWMREGRQPQSAK